MNATTGKLFAWSSLFVSIAFLISASVIVYEANAQEVPSTATHDLQTHNAQDDRSWQLGGFFAGGFAPFYEERLPGAHWREAMDLFNSGFEAGKMLTALHGPGFLHGRGEAALEVIPFWLAYYPKQEVTVYPPDNSNVEPSKQGLLGFSTHGVSVTPLLFRWNFQKQESGHFLPWAQLAQVCCGPQRSFHNRHS